MPRPTTRARPVALLCMFLVAFVGVVQAVHAHRDNPKLPSHECSICVVAHSGVLTPSFYYPVPVFVRTVLSVPSAVISQSPGFTPFLYIRPPPQA